MLAAAGLPILGRYLLLPAALLAVFCGAGAFGWRDLPPTTRGAGAGGAPRPCSVASSRSPPRRSTGSTDLRSAMDTQREILADLHAIAHDDRRCRPVAVPNHRPVPHLALWLDDRPGEIVIAPGPSRGAYIDPASERVARNFIARPTRPGGTRRRGAAGPRTRRSRATAPGCVDARLLKKVDRAPSVEVGLRGLPHLTDSGRATRMRPPVTA